MVNKYLLMDEFWEYLLYLWLVPISRDGLEMTFKKQVIELESNNTFQQQINWISLVSQYICAAVFFFVHLLAIYIFIPYVYNLSHMM